MGLFDSLSDKLSGTTHQLLNEKNQVTLSGNENAIATIKKIDREVGKLMKPFNGVARVPSDVVDRIEQLFKENEEAFTLVKATKAYEEGRLERLGNLLRNSKGTDAVPVDTIEYENKFKSPAGVDIEQRVYRIRLG